MAEPQGGEFARGFISAGFTKYVMYNAIHSFGERENLGHILARTAAAGAVGGTITQATGGKFVNGARTAAYAHLLNAEAPNVPGAVVNAQKNGGARRFARRQALRKSGTTNPPDIEPGVYPVVAVSASGTVMPATLEYTDLYMIDVANERVYFTVRSQAVQQSGMRELWVMNSALST